MKKLIAVSLALALVLSLGVSYTVVADEVVTNATVGGSGSAPFICAKWETPDHDPAPGTQIMPVPGDARIVKFYVVVGDPNGVDDIASVDVTVRYPDGTEKYQLRAIRPTWTQIPWGGLVDMDGDCTGETDITTAMNSLNAQGRITFGPGQTLSQVLYDIEHGKQLLIELVGEMDYHQPSCDYTVQAFGTDGGGNSGEIVSNTFFYISIVALRIDFNTINFGTVNVDDWNILYGDADMSTPARPTVWNIGNDPAHIMLHATPMIGAVQGKPIEDFDAFMLGERVEFKAGVDTIIPSILPPCTPTQIDFSLHPPYGTPQDSYSGTMTISILHATP
ncbi:MAG: hypothetical protein PHQ86_04970 [Dehalococcoidales bacterium]|nr:hypothetical protein [Dehalococcoidales bacterium]